jgi:hypothetical protein
MCRHGAYGRPIPGRMGGGDVADVWFLRTFLLGWVARPVAVMLGTILCPGCVSCSCVDMLCDAIGVQLLQLNMLNMHAHVHMYS